MNPLRSLRLDVSIIMCFREGSLACIPKREFHHFQVQRSRRNCQGRYCYMGDNCIILHRIREKVLNIIYENSF